MALRAKKCAVPLVRHQHLRGGSPLSSNLTVPLLKPDHSTAFKSSMSVAATSSPTSRWNHNRSDSLIKVEMHSESDWDSNRIPQYLNDTYWWAYIHPRAVEFFERQWLVDAILWGNYEKLRNDAFAESRKSKSDRHSISNPSSNTDRESGRHVLQMACVYGDFSHTLVREHLTSQDTLHIIDIAPIQLYNTAQKLVDLDDLLNRAVKNDRNIRQDCSVKNYKRHVRLSQSNSGDISQLYNSNSMDVVYLFFLLHEQPMEVRKRTVKEALRVVREGENSRLVIVDYHKPHSGFNPWKMIMRPILTYVEPFAIDLWVEPLEELLCECMNELNEECSMDDPMTDDDNNNNSVKKKTEMRKCKLMIDKDDSYFGGLYQKLVISKIVQSG